MHTAMRKETFQSVTYKKTDPEAVGQDCFGVWFFLRPLQLTTDISYFLRMLV